jgi:hypothetical protein
VAAIVFRTAIYKQLNDWDLIPRNEAFTELYFNSYDNLPKETVAGEKTPILFTIHNLENSNMSYPYVVYFIDAHGTKTIYTQGSVDLKNGEYKTISVPVYFARSNETGSVVVLLTQLNQQIDFLLPDNNQ